MVREDLELVAFGDMDKFNRENVKLFWEPTQVCNFTCYYCYYKTIKYPYHPENIDIESAIKFIKEIQKVKNVISINMNAAEPTLVKDIDVIVKRIKDSMISCKSFRMYSNISANIDLYRRIINTFVGSDINFVLFPSFHNACIDIDIFMSKIKTLKDEYKNNSNILIDSIDFMLEDDNCYSLASYTYNKYPGIKFSMRPIREKKVVLDSRNQFYPDIYTTKANVVSIYKDKDGEYLYEYFYPHKLPHIPIFKNWICQSWENMIYIGSKGFLKSCTLENDDLKMDIKSNTIIKRLMDKKRKICNCKSCYCDWDIPKYKITEYNWLKEWTKEDILKLRKL